MPWALLATVYILIGLGLFNLYSATSAQVDPSKFYDQVKWTLIGTASLIFWGVFLDLKTIERLAPVLYVIVCILLLIVDYSGHTAKGSQRWLVVGPIRIQPSEIAKFVIILSTAGSFTKLKGIHEFSLFTIWKQLVLVLIPFVLILIQPDLGTASLVLFIAGLQIAFVRIKLSSIAAVLAMGGISSWTAWNFVMHDYQKLRVLNFLNPMRDPRGAGYHSIQSMIGIGSGGTWGRGFQQGTQAHLNFLPERHTDFIFSVFAEEHGFVGCLVLVGLFVILVLQVFQIAEKAKDVFPCLVALGVAAFLLFHFSINVSMVLGVFPVVGVPLSLVSYGGSHMLIALSTIGLLVAVERKRGTA